LTNLDFSCQSDRMKRSRNHEFTSTLVLIAFTFLTVSTNGGCTSTSEQKFESSLNNGQCEAALEHVPENDGTIRYVGQAQRAAGTVLSYAATGAGYTADVLITVVGGAVIFTAVCGPMLAAQVLSTQQPGQNYPFNCLPVDLSKVKPTRIGASVYKETAELRCPDLTALSRSMRRVAGCEEKKEKRETLERANKTLTTLSDDANFMACITEDEKAAVGADLFRVREKLSRIAL
jgi:hypothetical protein